MPNAPPEEVAISTGRHAPSAAAVTTNGHQNGNAKAPLASLASTNASQDSTWLPSIQSKVKKTSFTSLKTNIYLIAQKTALSHKWPLPLS